MVRPRSGLNRLPVEEPAQVFRQGQGAGVTPRWCLLQTFETNRLQIARHTRLEAARKHRVGAANLLKRGERRFPLERRPARQRFVEDRPQAIDVGGDTDFLGESGCLFGPHVAGRSQNGPGASLHFVAVFQTLGKTEVGDLGDEGRGVRGEG